MSNISLKGSLLAPYAVLRAVDGNIEGNVIVESFIPNNSPMDHTELHNYPFKGCLPNIDCNGTTTEATTTTTTSGLEIPTPLTTDPGTTPTIPNSKITYSYPLVM